MWAVHLVGLMGTLSVELRAEQMVDKMVVMKVSLTVVWKVVMTVELRAVLMA